MSYPSNWTKTKFCEIAKRKSVRINNPKESGYDRYVGLEHLDSGELVVKRWGSSKDVSSSMQLFSKNDILFARRNTYLRRVSVALFDGVCSGDIIVIEPILKHIVARFLPIYMQFEKIENRIIAWSAGAFSKRIKWNQLSNFEVCLPPKEEQKKIVDIIWSIHTNKEKTENLIKIAEKLKKGLLEELLTKGIGHKKFKKTEIGEIPEGWKVSKIIDFCYVKGRIGWKGLKRSEFTKEGPLLITGTDFNEDSVEWSRCYHISKERYNESPEIMIKNKDILITKDGTIGKLAFVKELPCEASLNSHLLVVRPDERMLPEYLFYFLHSNNFKDFIELQKSGSTLKGLGQKKFANFKVGIPNLLEQKLILSKLSAIDGFCSTLKKHMQNLGNLRKKTLYSMLSGEIDILNQEVLT